MKCACSELSHGSQSYLHSQLIIVFYLQDLNKETGTEAHISSKQKHQHLKHPNATLLLLKRLKMLALVPADATHVTTPTCCSSKGLKTKTQIIS